jgi:hypothetical protein
MAPRTAGPDAHCVCHCANIALYVVVHVCACTITALVKSRPAVKVVSRVNVGILAIVVLLAVSRPL